MTIKKRINFKIKYTIVVSIFVLKFNRDKFPKGFHSYYIYILTNKYRLTFYIGKTNNLKLRLQKHKENIETKANTFAAKYNIEFLVYYEKFIWIHDAIAREKE
ncbi:GIY-YIG nuclease family protein [[Flexibacter] sp. ATCC 35103]|uniref:GIY-YIG nuclease family protein n=1 Tax=[Flexibacter] sp. ATCC 35103 TaxID=1937528 RepID=UPI003515FC01